MKQRILKNTTGFTLLEIMIAVGLFTVVMLVTTNMFMQSIDSQSRAVSSKGIQEGLNFALTIMANELSGAQADISSCGCTEDVNYFCVKDSGQTLTFKNSTGECIQYATTLVTPLINVLSKTINAGSPVALTPNNINVSKVNFFVESIDDATYPIAKLTILLKGESLDRETHPDLVSLQTTITLGQ